MKIKMLESKNNKLVFELDGATPEQVNSLRRAAVYKVPVLAIEDVYFTENNSVLYDEQIAVRLGLLALKANVDKLNLPDLCTCRGKGCKNCQVAVVLKEKGPKMVYAKDLKITGAEVLYPETPIVWLEETHEVDLKAAAILGTGEEHAKWNTGWMYYSACLKPAVCEHLSSRSEPRCADATKSDPNKFKVTLESWGQLAPKVILKKAVEIVKKELGELKLK